VTSQNFFDYHKGPVWRVQNSKLSNESPKHHNILVNFVLIFQQEIFRVNPASRAPAYHTAAGNFWFFYYLVIIILIYYIIATAQTNNRANNRVQTTANLADNRTADGPRKQPHRQRLPFVWLSLDGKYGSCLWSRWKCFAPA
jgi:hypothetical protein